MMAYDGVTSTCQHLKICDNSMPLVLHLLESYLLECAAAMYFVSLLEKVSVNI